GGGEDGGGAPAGPMAPVAHNLARVPDADVRAITTYVASIAGALSPAAVANTPTRPAAPTTVASTTELSGAAAIFAGACGACHSGLPGASAVDLARSTAINAPAPRNGIRLR